MESSEPDSLSHLPSSSSSGCLCVSGCGIVTPRYTSASSRLFVAAVRTVSRVFARRRTWLRTVCLCPSVTLSQRDALELDVVRFRPPTAPCAWLPRAPTHPLVLIHTRSLPGCGRLTPPSVVTQECPVMLAVRGWYSGGLYGLTRKRKDPPHPTAPSSRGLLGCGCVRGPGAAVWRLWQWC